MGTENGGNQKMGTRPSTILLIEDNELNQMMLSKRLEKIGFDVIHRKNGLQLLELVGHTQPDIILMDILLPDINGWDLARSLKADPRTACIPLIAVTALAMPGDREKKASMRAVTAISASRLISPFC